MCTVPGSWPGTQRASVNGGPYIGAAEEGKTRHPSGSHRTQRGGQRLSGTGPTSVTEVIHQHDLGDQLRRGAVQHAVDGAEQGGPALVVEGDDDAGVGQCLQVALADAARGRHRTRGGQVQLSGQKRELSQAHSLANGKSHSLSSL